MAKFNWKNGIGVPHRRAWVYMVARNDTTNGFLGLGRGR